MYLPIYTIYYEYLFESTSVHESTDMRIPYGLSMNHSTRVRDLTCISVPVQYRRFRVTELWELKFTDLTE